MKVSDEKKNYIIVSTRKLESLLMHTELFFSLKLSIFLENFAKKKFQFSIVTLDIKNYAKTFFK